jgi:predicted Zn-dependent peptidase
MRRALGAALAALLASGAGAACHHDGGAPPDVEPPDQPFRATRPPSRPRKAFETPAVDRFALDTSVDVLLTERHTLPFAHWDIEFPGGSITDPPGKEGRANLCAALMIQGGEADTGGRIVDMGSDLYTVNGPESVTLHGFALSVFLDDTLNLWSQILIQPGMSEASLNRLRGTRVAALVQARANPSAVASRVLGVATRGEAHPYARVPTEASYNAITVEDCRQYRADYLHGRGARLVVGGDITRAGVEAKFSSRLMDGLQAKPQPPLPAAAPLGARLVFADVPAAGQTIVTMWAPGPTRQSPDYYAASVLAFVLVGSGPQSRLGASLREMMGSTYSVSGGFSYGRNDGFFVVTAPVQNDRSAAAITQMLREAAVMRDTDASEDELQRGRESRVGTLPGRFATVLGTMAAFDDLAYYGLPLDHYRGFPAAFAAVDAGAVRRVAQQTLAAEGLHFIVVGDGRTVLPMLRTVTAPGGALEGTEILTVNAEGRPVMP